MKVSVLIKIKVSVLIEIKVELQMTVKGQVSRNASLSRYWSTNKSESWKQLKQD